MDAALTDMSAHLTKSRSHAAIIARHHASDQSVSQGFYSRWGQLTKLQSFFRKRNSQKSNIDKQNHHQETVGKLSPCLGST